MKNLIMISISLLFYQSTRGQENDARKDFLFENSVTKEKIKIEKGSRVTVWFRIPDRSIKGTVQSLTDSSMVLTVGQDPFQQTVPYRIIAKLKVTSSPSSQTACANCQSSFRFSAGYGFPLGSQLLDVTNNSSSSNGSYNSNSKGVYGSYGSGICLSASYTKMLSKSVGFDIGLQYLIGKKYQALSASSDSYYGTVSTSRTESVSSSHGLFLSPSLILQAGEGRFRPYIKTGLVIGTIKVTTSQDDSYLSGTTATSDHRKDEYTGGLPFGFKGGVGAEFGLNKKVNFFAELVFVSMSYFPHKGEVTEYNANGVDQLSSLQTSSKVVIYDNQTSYNSSTSTDPTQPSHALRSSLPMGSLSLNAGIRINLDKK